MGALRAFGDAARVIGRVGGEALSIDGTAWLVVGLAAVYTGGLRDLLGP